MNRWLMNQSNKQLRKQTRKQVINWSINNSVSQPTWLTDQLINWWLMDWSIINTYPNPNEKIFNIIMRARNIWSCKNEY